jgi:hypothetical protein
LIPVTDYKAFVANLKDVKEEAGVSEGKFPDSDQPAYVANWGKYAAISPRKEMIALKPAGIKVSGATAKEMATKDVVMLANLAQIKTKLRPEIAKHKEEILDDMAKNMTGDAEKFAPVAKAVVSQLILVADSFFRDASAATVGINFGENGISSTVMAEFEGSSYIGSMASSLKNSDATMLTGLPAAKYLFFGGMVNDAATATKVIDDLITPITAELAKVAGPESEAINKYVASIRKYIAATKGQSMGMLAPSGALGQEPIFQIVSVQSGDPAAMKAAYQDAMSTQQDLMKAIGGPAGDMMKTTTTPNAKTLEGVSFDLTHTEITAGNNPNAAQIDQAMKMMYGPDGINVLTATIGDKLLVGFGVSDTTLSSAIASVKSNADPLAKLPGVAAVTAQLPKSRLAAFYIPLDEVVTTIGTYAGAMGMPIQIQLPPDLPPIGVAVGTEGSAIRIDSYTPTDLVKALVAQAMQLYMQRMGGGPGGPGGL